MDLSRTVDNTDVSTLRGLWYVFYNVPEEYEPFWDSIGIQLVENLSVPAYAIDNKITLDPKWANMGVLAHEMAHISRTLLGESEKAEFPIAFDTELKTNKLLQYAWEKKPYMRTNDIEGHADCYRYLGVQMPYGLKCFYPKLF